MNDRSFRALTGVGIALSLGAAALGAPAEALHPILAHVPSGSTRADVPGLPGLQFNNFGRIYRSVSDRWVTVPTMTGAPAPGGTNDQVIFSGVGRVGAVLAREGETVVESPAGTLLNLSGGAIPRVNDAGDWAYAFTTAGRSLVVRSTAGVFSTIAASTDAAPQISASATWGNDFANAILTNDGVVAFQADKVNDPAFSETLSRLNLSNGGSSIIARATQTVPDGQQQAGDPVSLASLSYATTTLHSHVSGDGRVTLYLADLALPVVSRVVVRNGVVVLQANQQFQGNTVSAISECWLEPSGQWFALALLQPPGPVGATLAVIREGAIIARIGQPIFPGSTENWAVFTDYKGSTDEQFIVTGTTSRTDTASNQVAVLNAGEVIARSGDPVALDPDLLMNDNVFIHSFRDRTTFLSDALLVGGRIKNSATGTSSLGANASLLRIAVTPRRCSTVDIANDQGEAIHNYSAIPNPLVPNNGLTEGDYNLFFTTFFDAGAPADVADDQGRPLPPFGPGGTGGVPNNGVTEGDYNHFFSVYFDGCSV